MFRESSPVGGADYNLAGDNTYDGPFLVKGSANIINSNFERMQKAVYRTIVNQDEALIAEAVADAKA